MVDCIQERMLHMYVNLELIKSTGYLDITFYVRIPFWNSVYVTFLLQSTFPGSCLNVTEIGCVSTA